MDKTHGGNIWQAARRSSLKPEDIIDFSSSINPLGMSRRALAVLKENCNLLSIYPEQDACCVKAELSRFHNLPQKNILTGNGSTEFIYLIPQVFKPKKALIVEPAFSEYKNSLQVYGCKADGFIAAKETNFQPAVPELCEALKNRYDILYIGNPSNPAGALLKKNEILKIADQCRIYGALLVVDEAFIDFVEDESVKIEAAELDNLIVIRSMTKFFAMAGLRFGYLISNEDTVQKVASFQQPWSVNTLAQLCAAVSLKDRGYIEETKTWFKLEHGFLFNGLNSICGLMPYPSNANYFLAEVSAQGMRAKEIFELLLNHRIMVRDCSSFGLGDRFLRFAVKNRKDNNLLIQRLKESVKNQSLFWGEFLT